jgi:hypothetical protein
MYMACGGMYVNTVLQVCCLMTLPASRLHSIDARMIDECGADDGIRSGRKN